jgi:hypothetical protein
VQIAPAREAGKSREWNPEDEAPFISLYEHEKGSSLSSENSARGASSYSRTAAN